MLEFFSKLLSNKWVRRIGISEVTNDVPIIIEDIHVIADKLHEIASLLEDIIDEDREVDKK